MPQTSMTADCTSDGEGSTAVASPAAQGGGSSEGGDSAGSVTVGADAVTQIAVAPPTNSTTVRPLASPPLLPAYPLWAIPKARGQSRSGAEASVAGST